jgi:hypothetical protein
VTFYVIYSTLVYLCVAVGLGGLVVPAAAAAAPLQRPRQPPEHGEWKSANWARNSGCLTAFVAHRPSGARCPAAPATASCPANCSSDSATRANTDGCPTVSLYFIYMLFLSYKSAASAPDSNKNVYSIASQTCFYTCSTKTNHAEWVCAPVIRPFMHSDEPTSWCKITRTNYSYIVLSKKFLTIKK